MNIDPAPPARNRPLTGDAVRWAAARDEYLAGAPAEAVCRRHDLRLATFRRRARREGWRRMDQPEAAAAPPHQDEPLVIAEAPETPSGTPLTAARMVDRCWTHVQDAVAAGRLIEARGWLRLCRDLKPFVPHEEIAAREAGMDRADLREVETAQAAAAESAPPEAPSDDQNVAPPLHCFSAPESHEPFVIDEDAPRASAAAKAATPVSTRDLARLATRLAAVARQVEQAARDEAVRPPLHCFSPPESHEGPVDDLSRAMRDLQTEILAIRGDGPKSAALPEGP